MHKSLLLVDAHAAPVRHDAAGIGGHVCHGHAIDGDIRRRAVGVLTVLHTAHLGVVGRRPVAAVDGHRLSEVAAYALEHHHQPWCHENGVAAVSAGELPHPEIGGQLLSAVLLQRICVDLNHRFLSFHFLRLQRLPEAQERRHLAAAGHLPAREDALGAPPAVEHETVFAPKFQQLVLELLPGQDSPVAPQQHSSIRQPANRRPLRRASHIRRQLPRQLLSVLEDWHRRREPGPRPIRGHLRPSGCSAAQAPVAVLALAQRPSVHHAPAA